MKKVIETEKLPIKLWLDEIEPKALQQTKNLANHPFAFKHIAIMPDCHVGYGMPIGGVLATKDVVIPNAVGVDIGCGMCVVKTNIKKIQPEKIKEIFGNPNDSKTIRGRIPVGFNWHDKKQDKIQRVIDRSDGEYSNAVKSQLGRADKQIGTLGGGNHFVDILEDEEKTMYIMIHSGSRNLGKTIADIYNKKAKKFNKDSKPEVPKHWDLAYLYADSEEGENYLKDMRFCVNFALENRLIMMEAAMECTHEAFPDVEFGEIKNKAHNFARKEKHFGKEVYVHRKGATSAREGEEGIIPGSQGTPSYLVVGKGNKDSFNSCSHGAGRSMSRTKAKKTLSLEKETKKLEEKGIVHAIRGHGSLDEAPSSYKDIDEVMENQKDLVEIKTKLIPRGVIIA